MTRLVSTLLFALVFGLLAVPVGADENPVPNPRYVEREVEFMWTEGRYVWKDRFRVRAYPREPTVGSKVRLTSKIRRTRDGVGKQAPAPIRVECTVRREGGGQWVYTATNPGDSASFEHELTRSGPYIASIVTYYSEEETYTIALRFNVVRAPEPELDDAVDD